jgi:hypothetical protein
MRGELIAKLTQEPKMNFFFTLLTFSAVAAAQVQIPEGTRVRIRVADHGAVETLVKEPVIVAGMVVIEAGAKVEATAIGQHLTPVRVQAVDGGWLHLNAQPQRLSGTMEAQTAPNVRMVNGRSLLLEATDFSQKRGTFDVLLWLTEVKEPAHVWVSNRLSLLFMLAGAMMLGAGLLHRWNAERA